MTLIVRCNGCKKEFEPFNTKRSLDDFVPPGWVGTKERDLVAEDALGEQCYETRHYCLNCLKKLKRMKDD